VVLGNIAQVPVAKTTTASDLIGVKMLNYILSFLRAIIDCGAIHGMSILHYACDVKAAYGNEKSKYSRFYKYINLAYQPTSVGKSSWCVRIEGYREPVW